MPEEANEALRELINVPLNNGEITQEHYKNLLEDLREIEIKKWYGVWKFIGFKINFRYGVFALWIATDKGMRRSTFDLQDLNHNVDFSKEKR